MLLHFFLLCFLNIKSKTFYTPGSNVAAYIGLFGTRIKQVYPYLYTGSFDALEKLRNDKLRLIVTFYDYKLIFIFSVMIFTIIYLFNNYKMKLE